MNRFFKIKRNILKKGFTLIELLITLSIFAVTTGMVMYSQGKFDSSVLLSNLAYDIAITIRQAQTFGINVKEFTSSGGSKFSSYGVVFDLENIGNKQFNLFTDMPNINGVGNSDFDGDVSCPTNDQECVNKYVLKNNNIIDSICVGDNEFSCETVNKLVILFTRPDPDAKIFADDNIGSPRNFAKIVVSSVADPTAKRSIIVNNIGQIYVQPQP